MHGVEASGVIYLYDGGLKGLYCCVYESVYEREIPCAIIPESEDQPSLFARKRIVTDPGKASRVRASIPKKISQRALELVEHGYLTCIEDKEMAILKFLLMAYKTGRGAADMLGHPDVDRLFKAERHLMREVHLLKGFIRFSDYDSALGAVITPKNFVLPLLQKHFIMRYSQEDFIILDKVHKAALIYQDRKRQLIPVEDIRFPEVSEKEELYRGLWKQFYRTIAIEARENPRLRMTNMPKRYWENMTEMSELL